MNYPPVFEVISSDPLASSALGDSEIVRLFPAGEAPTGTERPYATWQIISGLPENYLEARPDIDRYTVQIDIWGDTLMATRLAAAAVRGAIETQAHVVGYRGEEKEEETDLYHVSFDVDWFVHRE